MLLKLSCRPVDVFVTYDGKRASDLTVSRYAVRHLVAQEVRTFSPIPQFCIHVFILLFTVPGRCTGHFSSNRYCREGENRQTRQLFRRVSYFPSVQNILSFAEWRSAKGKSSSGDTTTSALGDEEDFLRPSPGKRPRTNASVAVDIADRVCFPCFAS